MDLITINIDEYEPHPQNPHGHPENQLDALGKSLDDFEQYKNVVVWNGFYLAGHGVVEAARRKGIKTLDAQDMSHLSEEQAKALLTADILLPDLATIDNDLLSEVLAGFGDPLEIPGVDVDLLKSIDFGEYGGNGNPPEPPPMIDKAEELQEKWQCERGQLWQIESKSQLGEFHRVMCGDCRNAEDMAQLTDGEPVNGVFTSPPYAMQRAKQYGGVPTSEYVEWWEKVQTNVRAVLAGDGSFFVNIKAHRTKKQRVLYVMDLVLAMVREWGWWYLEEFCWTHQGLPGTYAPGFKNEFEPVYHFAQSGKLKFDPSAVSRPAGEGHYKRIDGVKKGYVDPERASPFGGNRVYKYFDLESTTAYPGNVINISIGATNEGVQAAAFPAPLPTFFIKAYSDPGDSWLDPFCGSGTVIVAAENERRIGYGMELLPKYCAVILQRLADHTGETPRLIED